MRPRAGTREVDYQTASPWQVTYYPGSAVQRTVKYSYNSSSLLSAINQLNWPSSGQTASESFIYNQRPLTEVDFPDYNATSKPDARATIAYATGSATIDHYGTVGGTANQATKAETDNWSTQTGATGAEETQVETSANQAESLDHPVQLRRQQPAGRRGDPGHQLLQRDHPGRQRLQRARRHHGAEQRAAWASTTLAYTDSANPNLPTVVTDPTGTTNNTYDSHGNLTSTQRTLNSSGDVSCTQDSYDSQGPRDRTEAADLGHARRKRHLGNDRLLELLPQRPARKRRSTVACS